MHALEAAAQQHNAQALTLSQARFSQLGHARLVGHGATLTAREFDRNLAADVAGTHARLVCKPPREG
jgi:hypothetical protein